MNDNLLLVKSVSKSYSSSSGLFKAQKSIQALSDVNLEIRRGQTLGLIGESGCGKTTIGNIISSLIRPDSGELLFESQNILRMTKKQFAPLRSRIKMIFQDPGGSFNPSHKILWSLSEELRGASIRSKTMQIKRIDALLEKVGFDRNSLNRYPHQLSGGQKQRAAILMALLAGPQLIVADEVVSALDLSIQAQILNLMRDLQAELGLSYLFISHDLDVVYYMSDTITVMYLGYVVEQGTAAQVYKNAKHPYTRLLFSTIHGKGEKFENPNPARMPQGACPFAGRCPSSADKCLTGVPELTERDAGHFTRCYF
jgi:oligopeptide/dipeptide ABC transporter, ATP-binding protein, C-terminal domain